MAELKQLYLLTYNSISFIFWLCVGSILLFSSKGGILNGLDTVRLWPVIAPWLKIAQTAAVLECLHSMVGLVRSPFLTCLIQVASRCHVVWIIFRFCPASKETFAMASTIGAWTAVELIRYPFYAINSISADSTPYVLKWLRYSAFFILYPIGAFSELRCMWVSLDFIRESKELRAYPFPMPNRLNFELDLYIFYVVLMLFSLPMLVHLYGYMISQRTKAISAKQLTTPHSKKQA